MPYYCVCVVFISLFATGRFLPGVAFLEEERSPFLLLWFSPGGTILAKEEVPPSEGKRFWVRLQVACGLVMIKLPRQSFIFLCTTTTKYGLYTPRMYVRV